MPSGALDTCVTKPSIEMLLTLQKVRFLHFLRVNFNYLRHFIADRYEVNLYSHISCKRNQQIKSLFSTREMTGVLCWTHRVGSNQRCQTRPLSWMLPPCYGLMRYRLSWINSPLPGDIMPWNMWFQIHLGDLYIVNISCYITKLPPITNIYWGDINDRQQAIPNQCRPRLRSSLSKRCKRVLRCVYIWQDSIRLVAMRYNRVAKKQTDFGIPNGNQTFASHSKFRAHYGNLCWAAAGKMSTAFWLQ